MTKSLLLLLLVPLVVQGQQSNRKYAAEVRAEFLHAWTGYKKYAWGHDDLKPLSKTYHDWYPEPLLMTARGPRCPMRPRCAKIASSKALMSRILVAWP